VLSTEVNCVESIAKEMNGIHQLLYFPSLAVAREFAARIAKKGHLQDGRPTLVVSPRDLVRGAKEFDRVHVTAAHLMNPWFSVLGVVGGRLSPEEVYGDQLPNLWAVETGLTSNPAMCRRVAGLDRFGLYSCSDAHSLENIGRECTLLDIEPRYDALMAAIRGGTTAHGVVRTFKFPIELTRYFLNWCSACKTPFDAWPACPQCGQRLTIGSRDRLDLMAPGRKQPAMPAEAPPFGVLHPLAYVIAGAEGRKPASVTVRRLAAEIVDQLASERDVLTTTPLADLLRVASTEVAQAIVNQRQDAPPVQLGQGGLGF
jgi:PHP family Zn ribbon phosphoesterase